MENIDPGLVSLAGAVFLLVLALIVAFIPCPVCRQREKEER